MNTNYASIGGKDAQIMQQAGKAMAVKNVSEKPGEIELLAQKVSESASAVSKQRRRVEGLADGLLGTSPEAQCEEPDEPQQEGAMGALREAIQRLDREIEVLSFEVNRLKVL